MSDMYEDMAIETIMTNAHSSTDMTLIKQNIASTRYVLHFDSALKDNILDNIIKTNI